MRFSTLGLFVISCTLLSAACAAPQRVQPVTKPVQVLVPAPRATACEARPFDAKRVHDLAHASIVRVVTENGSGSGFVVSAGGSQFIVTNHHVVDSGDHHSAEVRGTSSSAALRVALEVLKVDADEDLALLRPRSALGVKGLELREAPASIGESVAALGYPGIAGSEFALTLEPGTVTAAGRELGGAVRVQTNANINPGNSGGPVLDGCSRVVAVVSAKHTRAERVGIAVPVAALIELMAAQRAPQPAPEAAISARLEQFLREVRFRRSARVAAFFGREFLQREIAPTYENLLKSVKSKTEVLVEELRQRGELGKLTNAQARELLERLSKNEREALQIQTSATAARADATTTARRLLELNASDLFGGGVDEATLEGIELGRKGCAEAYVTVRGKGEVRRYVLHLHDRWGQWVIDGVKRVR